MDKNQVELYEQLIEHHITNGDFEIATELCRKILKINKGNENANLNYGVIELLLANHLSAINYFNKVIYKNPKNHIALSNRGVAKNYLNKFHEAILDFEASLNIFQANDIAYINKGIAHYKLGDLSNAEKSFFEAINIKQNADAYYNLGKLYYDQEKYDQCIAYLRSALDIQPNHIDAHINLSMCYLKIGNFKDGWEEYQWRWELNNLESQKRKFQFPFWHGENLKDKSIMIHCEQGIGDTLHFCRYIKLLKASGAITYLSCDEKLHSLLQSLDGVDHLITNINDSIKCDFSTTIMSIPQFFINNIEDIVNEDRYLSPTKDNLNVWGVKLGARIKPRVGINWKGNPKFEFESLRSIPLEKMIKAIPNGYEIVSLNIKPTQQEKILLNNMGIKTFHDEIVNLDDTASICLNLDYVVSTCTSIAHLAGSLGCKTILLLHKPSDWRWFKDGTTSPWYPTMSLIRQNNFNEWEEVLTTLEEKLIKKLH